MEEKVNMEVLIERIENARRANEEVVQFDDMVLARMNNYFVVALLKKQGRLKTEKMYLLKLFVQNAAQAIVNAELAEKLVQKEKLSAVGNAIGMVMHDLRSPIGNLMTITEIMRMENVNNEWIDTLEGCARQASEIFDDFIDFIREAPVKKEPVNISEVINNIAGTAAANSSIKHPVIKKHIPDGLLIIGDEGKLKRCFMTLVNNAVNVLDVYKIKNACIQISAEKTSNHQVKILVRDNGSGIPEEFLNTLFEPFVTKGTANGTGLGLAIVKQFITTHKI